MSYLKNLEKFNTHSMNEEVVLSVSTGRDSLISNISRIIDGNLFHPENMQHIVLTGPRGMGKSFLLRYFQIIIKNKDSIDSYIDFALLPEEQHNINLPSQFIDELLDVQNQTISKSATWNNKDENWGRSLNKLIIKIEEGVQKHKNYLFIAAVENIDCLIDNVFSSNLNQSKFRHLLSDTKHFMLFGSSKRCDIDTNYNKRLFFAFQKYPLGPWTEDDYSLYFSRRVELIKREKPDEFDNKDICLLKNKLKSISKFTGGSPRMAVVLTNLLFDEDAVTIAQTLNNYVEDLSPYYQDLMEKMPKNSRILFDAMVRSKENISQSELAELVGTKQSEISQAFKWLQNNNYLIGNKIKGEKFYRYAVADRVFVLFYYKRFIYQGLEYSHIKILAEFLISFYDSRELCSYALKYLQGNEMNEGIEFARLVFDKEKMSYDAVNWQEPEDIKNTLSKIVNSETDFSDVKKDEIGNSLDNKNEINIESRLKILKQLEEEKNIHKQAEELEKIGSDYYKVLNHFEKAIEYYQKALELREKEGDIRKQSLDMEWIGWNYKKLLQCEKAIEYYQRAFELRVKDDNISGQAWNLGQIGWNYKELQQYEKAIEYHQMALELRVKERDITEQAWNLGNIGWNYLKLKQYEKAIEYYKSAHELRVKEDNISGQAWNLGKIGWNYTELEQFEKAIEFHQRAYELRVKKDDISGQAWNLGRIGWNFHKLEQYNKAIEFHQRAYELRVKEDDISGQAWNLGRIGFDFHKLEQYNRAIEYHQRALGLRTMEGNIPEQAWNLERIGWDYKELQQFESALEYHQKALELRDKENNDIRQVWNLGQIGCIYLLKSEEDKALKLLAADCKFDLGNERIFKEFGDAIYFKEKWTGKAEAFSMANNILTTLSEKELKIDKYKALMNLFADILSMKLPYDLIEDICHMAKEMFGPEENVIIDATLHTIKYLELGKDEKYLKQINPDIAIAVQAIVEEAEL